MGILKMSSLALFLSFLLATVVAVPAPRNRVGDCAAADDYIDEVLVNVAKIIVEQGYDPAELPGDEVHFSQDIGFIIIHGSARYDQGHFDGLSTIYRTGETQLCVGDNIAVHANIGSATPELDITWLQSSRVLRSEQVLRPKSAALTSTLRPRWPCLGKVDFNLAGLRLPMWATSMSASVAWSLRLDLRQAGGGHRRHHQGLYHPPYRGTH